MDLGRHRNIMRGNKLELLHGEVVFLPNLPVQAVFLIEKGAILVFAKDGIKIKNWLCRGQVTGIQDLLLNGNWQGLGVAQGQTILQAFSSERIRSTIAASPLPHQQLLKDLASAYI